MVSASWNIGGSETLYRRVCGRAADETHALLRADCEMPITLDQQQSKEDFSTNKHIAGRAGRPFFCAEETEGARMKQVNASQEAVGEGSRSRI